MWDRLAGVGGEDTALDDGRGLERQSDLLRAFSIIGLDTEPLGGETEVADVEVHRDVAADPGEREPALVVGADRSRPGAESLGQREIPHVDAVERPDIAGPADAPDLQLDPRGRLTVDVNQLATDELLGLEADLGGRLSGVGIELSPAESEAGDRSQGMDLEEPFG